MFFLFLNLSLIHLFDIEQLLVVVLLGVDGQLSRLRKGFVAALEFADVGLVTGMNVHVIFKVLCKGKFLSTYLTREPTVGVMSYKMPPKAVFVGVCPVAVFI